MFFGFALLIAGALLLLNKMGFITGDFWDYFWPILLIALGGSMIFERKKRPKC